MVNMLPLEWKSRVRFLGGSDESDETVLSFESLLAAVREV